MNDSATNPPTQPFEVLSWDSERFGFPVARIAAGTSTRELSVLVEALREQHVGLAYWFSSHELSPLDRRALLDIGATLVDEKRTYLARSRAATPRHAAYAVRPYNGIAANDRLIMLSRAAGAWSRFRIDKRVPAGVFEAIYDAWITRSVRREIADVVLTALDASEEAVGVATVGETRGRAAIGLVAVDAAVRGRGVGRDLVHAASAWAAEQGIAEIQVVTQGANIAACALYEACGFVLSTVEYVYHLWRPFGRTTPGSHHGTPPPAR